MSDLSDTGIGIGPSWTNPNPFSGILSLAIREARLAPPANTEGCVWELLVAMLPDRTVRPSKSVQKAQTGYDKTES